MLGSIYDIRTVQIHWSSYTDYYTEQGTTKHSAAAGNSPDDRSTDQTVLIAILSREQQCVLVHLMCGCVVKMQVEHGAHLTSSISLCFQGNDSLLHAVKSRQAATSAALETRNLPSHNHTDQQSIKQVNTVCSQAGHSTSQHSTAQNDTVQARHRHGPAWHSTAQHSTPRSTAQCSTAKQRRAQQCSQVRRRCGTIHSICSTALQAITNGKVQCMHPDHMQPNKNVITGSKPVINRLNRLQ